MFTTGDDVPLTECWASFSEQEGGKLGFGLRKADDEALYAKLGEVLPGHDRERIYASDLRKLFGWYELLVKSGTSWRRPPLKMRRNRRRRRTQGEEESPRKAAAKKPDGRRRPRPSLPPKSAGKVPQAGWSLQGQDHHGTQGLTAGRIGLLGTSRPHRTFKPPRAGCRSSCRDGGFALIAAPSLSFAAIPVTRSRPWPEPLCWQGWPV